MRDWKIADIIDPMEGYRRRKEKMKYMERLYGHGRQETPDGNG